MKAFESCINNLVLYKSFFFFIFFIQQPSIWRDSTFDLLVEDICEFFFNFYFMVNFQVYYYYYYCRIRLICFSLIKMLFFSSKFKKEKSFGWPVCNYTVQFNKKITMDNIFWFSLLLNWLRDEKNESSMHSNGL